MEQPVGIGLLERISWDDLRIFVVVARALSFRKAATRLRTSSSTVMRRIERLEKTLGFRLFDRLPDGVGLTAEGRSVFATARQTSSGSSGAIRSSGMIPAVTSRATTWATFSPSIGLVPERHS